MSTFIRHYLLALQFFTRIPVTGRLAAWVGYSPAMLRASAAHFPGVGLLLGLLTASCSALLLAGLPSTPQAPWVAAALSTALGVLLTGAFHEDGLADVFDGLGGSPDRLRALEIMKDSRVGAFGAIALVLVLLCKVALLALLGGLGLPVLCLALLLGHVQSRTWPLFLIALLPHVGDLANTGNSKSKPLADQISPRSLGAALLWFCMSFGLLAYVLSWLHATKNIVNIPDLPVWLVALGGGLLASALVFGVLWRWFAKRLQGFTGDCLGTTQQLCELAFYLGLALAWRA